MKKITSDEACAVRNEQRENLEFSITYWLLLMKEHKLVIEEPDTRVTANPEYLLHGVNIEGTKAIVTINNGADNNGLIDITDSDLSNDDLIYLLAIIEEELVVKES